MLGEIFEWRFHADFRCFGKQLSDGSDKAGRAWINVWRESVGGKDGIGGFKCDVWGEVSVEFWEDGEDFFVKFEAYIWQGGSER